MSVSTGFLPAAENPFATEFVDSIPWQFVQGDWSTHMQRLVELRFRAAIVGPHGTGKTTLLEALAGRLRKRSEGDVWYLRVPGESCQHGQLVNRIRQRQSAGAVVLLDCIERLTPLQRWRLLAGPRKPGGLIVTCHRRTILPTWIRCAAGAGELRYVLEQLGIDLCPDLQRRASQMLGQTGNLRDVLRFLYDEYASGQFGALSETGR